MKYKNVKINGKIFPTVTIGQLAKICRRSTIMMQKMETRGILPEPNIRGKKMLGKQGEETPGVRMYSVTLAEKLSKILSEVTQGVALTNEQKRQINIAFQEEKQYINTVPTDIKPK